MTVGGAGMTGGSLRRGRRGLEGGDGLAGWGGAALFAEAFFAGDGFGAAALGAVGLGAVVLWIGGLFGVVVIGRIQRDAGGGPIWSEGLGVFGVVQVCSGLFRVVQGLFGGLFDGGLGVGEFCGGVFVDGGGDGFGVELGGVGGAEQVAGGEAVFAERGLERTVAVFEVADQVGAVDVLEEGLDCAVGVLGGEGLERSERVGDEFVDAVAEQGEVLEQGVVGGGAGELGLVGFDGAEVVMDGGWGDVEFFGDLADGEVVLAEFVCAEGASAALWGEGHGGRPFVVRVFCCDGSRILGKWGFLPAQE